MARLWSTGPVDCWVALDLTGPPLLLGWGRQAPVIEHDVDFVPYCSDRNGPRLPVDRIMAGEALYVSVALNRFKESTLQRMQDRTGGGRQGAVRGRLLPGGPGSMVVAESLAYVLYLRFPNSSKPTFRSADDGSMVPGYRVFQASLDPESIHPGTGREKHHVLHWTAVPVEDGTVADEPYGNAGGLLFDHNLDELAGLRVD